MNPRTLILYPEEQLALDRGASLLLILDRPGLVLPEIGERLLGRTGREEGRLLEVVSLRETVIDGITDDEAEHVKKNGERFIPWLMRMLGPVLWSPDTGVYPTGVRAVAL